jgi:hypothetical protein
MSDENFSPFDIQSKPPIFNNNMNSPEISKIFNFMLKNKGDL